jgi:pimeloyl-ACP methyl ester carboxylesterase
VLLALPKAPAAPVPLVVLLHGLAETVDAHIGARAWVDRYGLSDAVRRLSHPPLALTGARDDWGGALAATNAALAGRAYRGLAFACPHVPRMPSDKIDAYARWLNDVLVPRARAEAGDRISAALPRLGGCSYGGWVSLEVFLRAPDRFAAWAGVQTAITAGSAPGYVDRLLHGNGGRPLLFETSDKDPFHDGNVAMSSALAAHGVSNDLLVLPGPHDQAWLKESGTASAVAWLDRREGS